MSSVQNHIQSPALPEGWKWKATVDASGLLMVIAPCRVRTVTRGPRSGGSPGTGGSGFDGIFHRGWQARRPSRLHISFKYERLHRCVAHFSSRASQSSRHRLRDAAGAVPTDARKEHRRAEAAHGRTVIAPEGFEPAQAAWRRTKVMLQTTEVAGCTPRSSVAGRSSTRGVGVRRHRWGNLVAFA